MIEILYWPESKRHWNDKAWLVGWVHEEKTQSSTFTNAVRTTIVIDCVAQQQNHEQQQQQQQPPQGVEGNHANDSQSDMDHCPNNDEEVLRRVLHTQIDLLASNLLQTRRQPTVTNPQKITDCQIQPLDCNPSHYWSFDCQRGICGLGLVIVGVFRPTNGQGRYDEPLSSNDEEYPQQRVYTRINHHQDSDEDQKEDGGSFPWFLSMAPSIDGNTPDENGSRRSNDEPLVATSIATKGQIVFYKDCFSHSYHNSVSQAQLLQGCPQQSLSTKQQQQRPLAGVRAASSSWWLVRLHNAVTINQELFDLMHQTSCSPSPVSPSTNQHTSDAATPALGNESLPSPTTTQTQPTIDKDQVTTTSSSPQDSLLLQMIDSFQDLLFQSSFLFRLVRKYHAHPTSWPWAILFGRYQENGNRRRQLLLLKDEQIQQKVNQTGTLLHTVWNLLLGTALSCCVIMALHCSCGQPDGADATMTTTTINPAGSWIHKCIQFQFHWLKGSMLIWLQSNPIGIKVNFHLANALTSNLTTFLDMVECFWLRTVTGLIHIIGSSSSSWRYYYLEVFFALIPTVIGGLSGWLACIHDLWQCCTGHVRIMTLVVAALFRLECHVLVATARLFRGQKRNILRNHRTDSMSHDSTQLLLGSILFAVTLFLFTTILVYHVALFSLEFMTVHVIFKVLRTAYQLNQEKLPLLFGALYYQIIQRKEWFPQDIYLVHEKVAHVRTSAATAAAATALAAVDLTHLHTTQSTAAQIIWSIMMGKNS